MYRHIPNDFAALTALTHRSAAWALISARGSYPFRLQDEVVRWRRRLADDEVRLVIVRLAVVEVGNREAEPRVLHEGGDGRVSVDDIRGGLLPLLVSATM